MSFNRKTNSRANQNPSKLTLTLAIYDKAMKIQNHLLIDRVNQLTSLEHLRIRFRDGFLEPDAYGIDYINGQQLKMVERITCPSLKSLVFEEAPRKARYSGKLLDRFRELIIKLRNKVPVLGLSLYGIEGCHTYDSILKCEKTIPFNYYRIEHISEGELVRISQVIKKNPEVQFLSYYASENDRKVVKMIKKCPSICGVRVIIPMFEVSIIESLLIPLLTHPGLHLLNIETLDKEALFIDVITAIDNISVSSIKLNTKIIYHQASLSSLACQVILDNKISTDHLTPTEKQIISTNIERRCFLEMPLRFNS